MSIIDAKSYFNIKNFMCSRCNSKVYVYAMMIVLMVVCRTKATSTSDTLANFRMISEGTTVALKSDDTTLCNALKHNTLPYGFVLPDLLCDNEELAYVIDFQFVANTRLNPEKRYALFTLGMNISGHEANSLTLAFLNDNMHLAFSCPICLIPNE